MRRALLLTTLFVPAVLLAAEGPGLLSPTGVNGQLAEAWTPRAQSGHSFDPQRTEGAGSLVVEASAENPLVGVPAGTEQIGSWTHAPVPVRPGMVYTAEVWVASESKGSFTGLELTFFDQGGRELPRAKLSHLPLYGLGYGSLPWIPVSLTFVAPPGAATVQVALRSERLAGPIRFDRPSLHEGALEFGIPPGGNAHKPRWTHHPRGTGRGPGAYRVHRCARHLSPLPFRPQGAVAVRQSGAVCRGQFRICHPTSARPDH